MAFDSKKTILLEKTYLYVRASLGFQLEGTSTEKIPTNNGFYRFFVDNLQKAIGNSYVNILYDSQDLSLQCFCSDLYMDELMSSDSSAIEDVVEELKKNTTTIIEFENGVSSSLESNHKDNVALFSIVNEFQDIVSNANTNLLNLLNNSALIRNYGVTYAYNFINVDVDDFEYFYANNGSGIKSYYKQDLQSGFVADGSTLFEVTIPCSLFTFNNYIDPPRAYIWFIAEDGSKSSLSLGIPQLTNDKLLFNKQLWYNALLSRATNFDSINGKKIVLCSLTIDCDSDMVGMFRAGSYYKDSYSYVQFVPSADNLLRICSKSWAGCCLNLNFDFPFNGGYLDFQFENRFLRRDLCSFVFITDVGQVSFTAEQLGLKLSLTDKNFVVCTNFPNVSINGRTITRLLGLRVLTT